MKKRTVDIMQSVKRSIVAILAKVRIDNEVTDNLLRSIPLWIGSLLVGIIAVLYAQLFAFAERLGSMIVDGTPFLVFIIMPACFIVSWLIVQYGAPFARGSGIPQVVAALEISGTEQQRKVPLLVGGKIIFVKIISSVIMVFGGGAIGREGPTIQISGALFRFVGKILPAHWPKFSERVMIMTGSAAGLAAAFNTPLGGIVFAIEELSRSHFNAFRTTLLTAVIIAGMTAQVLLGPYLYLGYPQVSGVAVPLISLIVLIGIITGLFGALFSRIIVALLMLRSSFQSMVSKIMFTVALAFIMAGIAFFITPHVLGSGKEQMISLLFSSNLTYDPMLAVVRFFGPILSFASGAAAGVFAPSLSSGAAIGSAFSSLFTLTPQESNVIVLSGMVGFLTAVTRSPFTSSILVLEMTDRHSLIFYLMLAGLISYATTWLSGRESLYERLKESYKNELKTDHVADPTP